MDDQWTPELDDSEHLEAEGDDNDAVDIDFADWPALNSTASEVTMRCSWKTQPLRPQTNHETPMPQQTNRKPALAEFDFLIVLRLLKYQVSAMHKFDC